MTKASLLKHTTSSSTLLYCESL